MRRHPASPRRTPRPGHHPANPAGLGDPSTAALGGLAALRREASCLCCHAEEATDVIREDRVRDRKRSWGLDESAASVQARAVLRNLRPVDDDVEAVREGQTRACGRDTQGQGLRPGARLCSKAELQTGRNSMATVRALRHVNIQCSALASSTVTR